MKPRSNEVIAEFKTFLFRVLFRVFRVIRGLLYESRTTNHTKHTKEHDVTNIQHTKRHGKKSNRKVTAGYRDLRPKRNRSRIPRLLQYFLDLIQLVHLNPGENK